MTFAACGMSPVLCSARIFLWAALPPLAAWTLRMALRARPWLLSAGLALGAATISGEDMSDHATDGQVRRLPSTSAEIALLRLFGSLPERPSAQEEKEMPPRAADTGREQKDQRFALATEKWTSDRWHGCRRRRPGVPSSTDSPEAAK